MPLDSKAGSFVRCGGVKMAVRRSDGHVREAGFAHYTFIHFRNCRCAGFSTRCSANTAMPIRIT